MAREDELRRSSPRRVRVKIITQHSDLDSGVFSDVAANSAASLSKGGVAERYWVSDAP
jgi:hypothetical protein